VTVGEKLRSAAHVFDGARPSSVGPAARDSVAARLEKLTFLDPVAAGLQTVVRKAVPRGTVKDLLSGTWLGHPVHPPLTDVVVGSWTSAWLLDLFGGKRARGSAQLLLGAGIAAALPTAATGASDWSDLRGGTRRVGLVHALGNTSALVLQILSLRNRRRGDHWSGVALSSVAMAVAGTPVVAEVELASGRPLRREADGIGVTIVRDRGEIHAIADRCSHRGCSLAEGTVRDGTITCACHGSTFALEDGAVVTGPATAPQPSPEVRVRDGAVEVRRRSAGD
jgi:nitrite reductase/ring-hydroxylating ferredoxin subunit